MVLAVNDKLQSVNHAGRLLMHQEYIFILLDRSANQLQCRWKHSVARLDVPVLYNCTSTLVVNLVLSMNNLDLGSIGALG